MAWALDYENNLSIVALIFRNIWVLCNLETKFSFYFNNSVLSDCDLITLKETFKKLSAQFKIQSWIMSK